VSDDYAVVQRSGSVAADAGAITTITEDLPVLEGDLIGYEASAGPGVADGSDGGSISAILFSSAGCACSGMAPPPGDPYLIFSTDDTLLQLRARFLGTTPTVATVSAPVVGEGETVTITGSHFSASSVTQVLFGGIPATSFAITGPSALTAVVPAAAGLVDVRVSGEYGTSPAGAPTITVVPRIDILGGLSPQGVDATAIPDLTPPAATAPPANAPGSPPARPAALVCGKLPPLVGRSPRAALRLLSAYECAARVRWLGAPRRGRGARRLRVIAQSPRAGAPLPAGRPLVLTLARVR